MKDKVIELKSFGGEVRLKYHSKLNMILAKPKGFIHPSLVKVDLLAIQKLSLEIENGWIYIVDTTDVLFANPLNIFYLRKIQYQKGFGAFWIIAKNPIIRLLQKLTASYLGISHVYKNSKELDIHLDIS